MIDIPLRPASVSARGASGFANASPRSRAFSADPGASSSSAGAIVCGC
jgi:hypothetical protein